MASNRTTWLKGQNAMPDDKATPALNRYIPTLTEVVTDALAPSGDAPAPPARAATAVPAVTAEQLLALLAPDLDQRISEAIAQAVHEQMLGLQARVRRGVAAVVQDAVDTALRQAGDGPLSG